MDIFVEPNKLMQRSNDIRLIRSEIEKIMTNIELLVVSLNGNWQGDAERACSGKIIYIKKEYAEMLAFLNDYANLLDNCSIGYEQYDAELESKINLT